MSEKIKSVRRTDAKGVGARAPIKVGDLVVWDESVFDGEYIPGGFLLEEDGDFDYSSGTNIAGKVMLYLGRFIMNGSTFGGSTGNFDIVLLGDQKLYVRDILPELKKINGQD